MSLTANTSPTAYPLPMSRGARKCLLWSVSKLASMITSENSISPQTAALYSRDQRMKSSPFHLNMMISVTSRACSDDAAVNVICRRASSAWLKLILALDIPVTKSYPWSLKLWARLLSKWFITLSLDSLTSSRKWPVLPASGLASLSSRWPHCYAPISMSGWQRCTGRLNSTLNWSNKSIPV